MRSDLSLLAEIDAMCLHLAFPRGGKYAPSVAVMVSIATSSVNGVPIWLGKAVSEWKGRETVIMREMSRSNGESSRRNGKPQDCRRESLLILLSILRKTVPQGRK